MNQNQISVKYFCNLRCDLCEQIGVLSPDSHQSLLYFLFLWKNTHQRTVRRYKTCIYGFSTWITTSPVKRCKAEIWALAFEQMWRTYSLRFIFSINTHIKNILGITNTPWYTRSLYHDNVIKWKHFPHYWPFVRGIHHSPANSSHKGQWCGALMFPLICALNKQSWG